MQKLALVNILYSFLITLSTNLLIFVTVILKRM
ncbi:hypothetical protein KR52_01545 [Synechococcus sp. KORDI-52]|nr:hypothetical protein KR52_01545 [Synechococcus sp. KORDI-52]